MCIYVSVCVYLCAHWLRGNAAHAQQTAKAATDLEKHVAVDALAFTCQFMLITMSFGSLSWSVNTPVG